LPSNDLDRHRIARGLGFDDWTALRAALDTHRERVANEFEALLAPRGRSAAPSDLATYWRALPDAGDAQALADAGFRDSDTLDGSLRDFARAPGVRTLSDATRARLDRVLPELLASAARSSQPDAALRRVLPLLHTLLRRASYLALLDEQPAALARLVDVVSGSALLAERIAAHPLLLDELLDRRTAEAPPGRDALVEACAATLREDDPEAALMALNEVRQALSFRIALATLDARQSAQDSARQLAWLADGVVAVVVELARREIERAHGGIADARFAVLGYGSLGGEELGFGSDLDLVFLYDAPADAHSDGARALDASRWFARLAQKIVALLGTVTGAGRLYDIDVRLRPDGAKGLLVSTLASFSDYQRERAWTWEHQALVRARGVAGDPQLLDAFERVRAETLARTREPDGLRHDIVQMRQRMRAELDRTDAARFDLKQGEGGLVDLEFLLQWRVLARAATSPGWLGPRDTPGLLRLACEDGLVDAPGCEALIAAHAALLDAGLRCTLDRRPRITAETDAIAKARAAIRAATHAAGLAFA
jgi:glutamate-ammonia-ligase adenylyltransferase